MVDPITIHVRSPEETRVVAQRLAQGITPGTVVALEGDLGAGKTFFCQALAEALGVEEPVTSPSFAIIQEYQGRMPIFHFDFYRLGSQAEVIDLGFEDYLDAQGLCLIEWPQIAMAMLPAETIFVKMSYIEDGETASLPDSRNLSLSGLSEKQRKLIQS